MRCCIILWASKLFSRLQHWITSMEQLMMEENLMNFHIFMKDISKVEIMFYKHEFHNKKGLFIVLKYKRRLSLSLKNRDKVEYIIEFSFLRPNDCIDRSFHHHIILSCPCMCAKYVMGKKCKVVLGGINTSHLWGFILISYIT